MRKILSVFLLTTVGLMTSCGGGETSKQGTSSDVQVPLQVSVSETHLFDNSPKLTSQGAASYTWLTYSKTEESQTNLATFVGEMNNLNKPTKGTWQKSVQTTWTANAGVSNTVSILAATTSLGITYSLAVTETASLEVPGGVYAKIYAYPIGYRYKGQVRECVQNMGLSSCVTKYADFFSPRGNGYLIK